MATYKERCLENIYIRLFKSEGYLNKGNCQRNIKKEIFHISWFLIFYIHHIIPFCCFRHYVYFQTKFFFSFLRIIGAFTMDSANCATMQLWTKMNYFTSTTSNSTYLKFASIYFVCPKKTTLSQNNSACSLSFK